MHTLEMTTTLSGSPPVRVRPVREWSSACTIRLANVTLPAQFRSAFLLASILDLARRIGGNVSVLDSLEVKTASGWARPRQFMGLPGSAHSPIRVRGVGRVAALICERLPDFTLKRLSEVRFDADGYAEAA